MHLFVTYPASGPLYPISGTANPRSDDGSSPRINLRRPFFYFGRSYNQIYVCRIHFHKVMYIYYVDFEKILQSNLISHCKNLNKKSHFLKLHMWYEAKWLIMIEGGSLYFFLLILGQQQWTLDVWQSTGYIFTSTFPTKWIQRLYCSILDRSRQHAKWSGLL